MKFSFSPPFYTCILLGIIFILMQSCRPTFIGKYKSTAKTGFYEEYDFKQKKFKYLITGDVLGEYRMKGKFRLHNDSIYLEFTDMYTSIVPVTVREINIPAIEEYTFTLFELNGKDTLPVRWGNYLMINELKKTIYLSDSTGQIKTKTSHLENLTSFRLYGPYTSIQYFVKDSSANCFNIYLGKAKYPFAPISCEEKDVLLIKSKKAIQGNNTIFMKSK